MKLLLQDVSGESKIFELSKADKDWRNGAAGSKFLPGVMTSFSAPLHLIFLKKVSGVPTAEKLIAGAMAHPLLFSPRVVGITHFSQFYVVAYVDISAGHRLLDDVVKRATEKALKRFLLESNLGYTICKSAAMFLHQINNRGFVYPDFCPKNILINGPNACAFIDLDSSFPLASLRRDLRGAVLYDEKHWGVWRKVSKSPSAGMLSRTMVLSFAGSWARASSLLRSGADIDLVKNAVVNMDFASIQDPFWSYLKEGDFQGFVSFFSVKRKPSTKELFARWQKIMNDIVSGDETGWPDIVMISHDTLCLGRNVGQRKAWSEYAVSALAFIRGAVEKIKIYLIIFMVMSLAIVGVTLFEVEKRPISAAPSPWPAPIVVSPPAPPDVSAPPAPVPSAPVPPAPTPPEPLQPVQSLSIPSLTGPSILPQEVPSPESQSGSGTGPSFPCAKAISWVLKTVCSDGELSALDRTLAGLYSDRLKDPVTDLDALRRSQKNWQYERLECRDRECIKSVFQRRIRELGG